MTKDEAISTLEWHKLTISSKEDLYYDDYELLNALNMAIDALGESVAYICDEEACDSCNNPECHHTLDIYHAKNFEEIEPGKFMEVSQ